MIEALDAEAALSESARPIRKRGKTTGDDVSPEAAESPNKKPKADEVRPDDSVIVVLGAVAFQRTIRANDDPAPLNT